MIVCTAQPKLVSWGKTWESTMKFELALHVFRSQQWSLDTPWSLLVSIEGDKPDWYWEIYMVVKSPIWRQRGQNSFDCSAMSNTFSKREIPGYVAEKLQKVLQLTKLWSVLINNSVCKWAKTDCVFNLNQLLFFIILLFTEIPHVTLNHFPCEMDLQSAFAIPSGSER